MSNILDLFGLTPNDFYMTDELALCGNDRKTFGQIKRDKDGHYRIIVGKDAQDCNSPIKRIKA